MTACCRTRNAWCWSAREHWSHGSPSGRRPPPRRGNCRQRRSPNITRPAPAHPAAQALRWPAGAVQPVLADCRGADLWLRVLGLGLCGAGRAPMDHRLLSRSGADRRLGRGSRSGRLVLAGAARSGPARAGLTCLRSTTMTNSGRGCSRAWRNIRACALAIFSSTVCIGLIVVQPIKAARERPDTKRPPPSTARVKWTAPAGSTTMTSSEPSAAT